MVAFSEWRDQWRVVVDPLLERFWEAEHARIAAMSGTTERLEDDGARPPLPSEKWKECPTCWHRWADKHGKDECPKCLNRLSDAAALEAQGGARRAPGEVSTFKQPPASAMESSYGTCPCGGAHAWKFGRCQKCHIAEGHLLSHEYAYNRSRPAPMLQGTNPSTFRGQAQLAWPAVQLDTFEAPVPSPHGAVRRFRSRRRAPSPPLLTRPAASPPLSGQLVASPSQSSSMLPSSRKNLSPSHSRREQAPSFSQRATSPMSDSVASVRPSSPNAVFITEMGSLHGRASPILRPSPSQAMTSAMSSSEQVRSQSSAMSQSSPEPLSTKVRRIVAFLGLNPSLPALLAIQQANAVMGLQARGTLPEQADVLLEALGPIG